MKVFDIYLKNPIKEFDLYLKNRAEVFDVYLKNRVYDFTILVNNLTYRDEVSLLSRFIISATLSGSRMVHFRLLGEIDPEYLEDIDNLTLAELDYIVTE